MSFKDIMEVADEKYLYLTTMGRKTQKPHIVEVWFVVAENRVYLSHEGVYSDWMKNILNDAQVDFRIGNHQFQGKARLIQDGVAFDIGKHALYLKYYGYASKDKIDDWFSESTVIEITT